MEHGRYVEKLRVKGQTLACSGQGGPIVNAHGMLKQPAAFAIEDDLSCVPRQFAVRNSYPRNLVNSVGNGFSDPKRDRFDLTVLCQGRSGEHQCEGGPGKSGAKFLGVFLP